MSPGANVNELTKMKRQTKHIRISASNHKRLKQASVDTGKTISVIADEIIDEHFRSKERQPLPTESPNKAKFLS
jgi:predicted DNA-binding protein